jgi:hypothetical protein
VADTEEIPRGVWRDLSASLEIYNGTLKSLISQVKHTAGLTQAHPPDIGNSTLKITRVALPKEKLQELTAGERSLFLLLGYASNQINTLWKLIVVATNEVDKDPVEEKVSAAQTQIFVRLLIGIMREGLKLIDKRFLGSPLGKEYAPRLSVSATEALKRLKKRFGTPDKFVVIRDNFCVSSSVTGRYGSCISTCRQIGW